MGMEDAQLLQEGGQRYVGLSLHIELDCAMG